MATGVKDIALSVSWETNGSPLSLSLEMPDNTIITPQNYTSFSGVSYATNGTTVSYDIDLPEDGQWYMTVGGGSTGLDYRATAYGESCISAKLELEHSQYNQTENVPILLRTSYHATNVYVIATNATDSIGVELSLYDDGSHNDGNANDGLYGAEFTNAVNYSKSWRLTAHVDGQINDSEFHRVTEESIYIIYSSWSQLGTVTNVVATDGSNDAVTVSWDSVTSAAYYDVYRDGRTMLPDATLICVTNGLSFTDTTTVPDITYSYWVKAYKRYKTDGEFSDPDTGYSE